MKRYVYSLLGLSLIAVLLLFHQNSVRAAPGGDIFAYTIDKGAATITACSPAANRINHYP